MDIRNSVGTSSWIGEITYTNPSSTFFDDRLALFQVRTSASSNGGGQFFLVTHNNRTDNFNYNVQMYEDGGVAFGSNGGNDGVFTSPASKIWNRGNVAIGTTANGIYAPTNGLYVQGDVIANSSLNTTRINATTINSTNIQVKNLYAMGGNVCLTNGTGCPSSSGGDNATWNQTLANSLYYSISNPSGYLSYADTISNADTCALATDALSATSATQLNDGSITLNNDGNNNFQTGGGGFILPSYLDSATSVEGLVGYNYSSKTPLFYNGTAWKNFNESSSSSSAPVRNINYTKCSI